MNTGAILTGLALLVIAMPFVVSPFLREERRKSSLAPRQNADPEKRKTATLLALSDLDFDYQTGKVAQEDYEILRPQLVAEAGDLINTVRQEMNESEKPNHAQAGREERDNVEELIRARREMIRAQDQCAHCGKPLHALDQYCPGCGSALGKDCPKCGKKVGLSDQFCPGCGTGL